MDEGDILWNVEIFVCLGRTGILFELLWVDD